MRKILTLLLLLFINPFLFVNNVIAEIGIIDSISLDSSTESSLDISWSEVPGASGYYIYYSESPRVDGYYDDPIAEFIEDNNYIISDLEKSTKYYISIKVVDLNYDDNEGPFSDEVSFVTRGGSSLGNTFGLSSVKIEKLNKIVLKFSSPIEDGPNANRDFKIVQRDDASSFIYINSTEVQNSNELVIELESELIIGKQYDLTVISISSETGETISSGVNSLKSFYVSEDFRPIVDEPVIEKKPACYGLILGDTVGDAPFETSVSCEGNDVDNFKIECGNGQVIFQGSNGLNTYLGKCNYTEGGSYEVTCFVNNDITNDYCKETIQIYSDIDVLENPVVEPLVIKKSEEESSEVKSSEVKSSEVKSSEVKSSVTYDLKEGGNIGGTNIEISSQGGTNIDDIVYANNIEVVASEQDELAKAGPESIIILLLSLVFGLFVMIGLKSKRT